MDRIDSNLEKLEKTLGREINYVLYSIEKPPKKIGFQLREIRAAYGR